MNIRFAMLLTWDPLNPYLSLARAGRGVEAMDRLMQLPRVQGDVDRRSLEQWEQAWLSPESIQRLNDCCMNVLAMPARPPRG